MRGDQVGGGRRAGAVQASFEELGTPLYEATFAVLDLETTGLSPDRDRITEVGVVKVCRGDVVGEFHALVAPGVAIPPAIARLTGITDHLVADRPPIEAVVPALLEFLRGTCIVAHNAHFDLGFLQATLRRHDYPALDQPVVDTARLARRVLLDGEVRDRRLSTLAHHFRARTKPEHRALADARATVDVFHGLLERVGTLGVRTLEDLRDYTRSSSDPAYRKVGLVDGAPDSPGVYRFLDRDGRVLYVGKAVRLRTRLRQYFGQDPRRRISDLVRDTTSVTWELTPTELEAQVREVRAIGHHQPRYNRRSRDPGRGVFVKLTRERFPRLSIVTEVRDERALHIGPLRNRAAAERFVDAIHDVIPLRQCTDRLTATRGRAPCVLKDLGRCGAPCDGTQPVEDYATVVERYRTAITEDPSRLLAELRRRMIGHARSTRFEQAQRDRRRLHAIARVLADARGVRALVAVDQLVAARRDGPAVEVALVQRGRLSGTARLDDGPDASDVRAAVELLRRTAGAPPPAGAPPRRDLEEIALVRSWLQRHGVRILAASGTYAEPVAGAAALHATVAEATRVARAVTRDRQVASGRKIARRAG